MSTSLAEFIQKKMGYPPLQKVDPVDHEIKYDSAPTNRQKLAQAAIPSVLAILYKFTRSQKGRAMILADQPRQDWLDLMLQDREKAAVDKVAQYAGVSDKEAEEHMMLIAVEGVHAIREATATHPTDEAVKKFVGDQRHSILVYLPAALQLGRLLEDDSLDDRTNKMEGPISNLMHSIEDKFSGGGA